MFQTEPTSRIWRHSFPVNCIKNEKETTNIRKKVTIKTHQVNNPSQ